MLIRYPFDPTGRSPDNFVRNELHPVELTGNAFVFPKYGAFYQDSLVVRQGDRVLKQNEDWRYIHFWQDVTLRTGQPVFMGIQLTNKNLLGELFLDYQVVGGEYQADMEQLKETLKNLPSEVDNVFWDDVINKPEAYIPTRHIHQITDVFGLNPLVLVIEQLKESLERQSVLKLKTVYDRFLKLKQYVESLLGGFDEKNKELGVALAQLDGRLGNLITRDDIDSLLEDKVQQQNIAILDNVENAKQEVLRVKDGIRDELATINDVVNRVESNITLVQGNVTKLETYVNETLHTFEESLGNSLSDMDNRFNQINNTLSEQFNQFERAQGSELNTLRTTFNVKIEEKVAEVESRLGDISGNTLNEVRECISQLTTTVNTVSSNINNHEQRITALENKPNVVPAEVTAQITEAKNTALFQITNTITPLTEKVTQLESTVRADIVTLTEKVNTLPELTNQINDVNTQLTNSINDVNDRLNTVDSTLTNMGVRFTNVDNSLITLRNSVNDLASENVKNKNNLNNLTSTVNSLERNIDQQHIGNQEQYSDLVQRIISLREKTEANATKLNDNIKKITNNLSFIFETIEPLDTLRNDVSRLNASDLSLTNIVNGLSRTVDTLNTTLTNEFNPLKDNVTRLERAFNEAKLTGEESNTEFKRVTEDKLFQLTNELGTFKAETSSRFNGLVGELDKREEKLTRLMQTYVTQTDFTETITRLENSDTTLTEKIETLKNDISPKVAKNILDITNLSQRTTASESNIGALNGNLNTLSTRQDTFTTKQNDHERRLVELENVSQAQDGAIGAKVTEVLTTRLNPIQSELESLKGTVEHNTQQINVNTQNVDAIMTDFNNIISGNENLQRTVSNLEQSVSNLGQSIPTDIRRLTDTINTVNNTVKNLNASFTAFKPDIERKVAAITTVSDRADKQAKRNKSDIEGLQRDVEQQDNQYTLLRGRMEQAETDILKDKSDIRAMNVTLKGVTTKITEQQSSVEELTNDVTQVKNRLNDMGEDFTTRTNDNIANLQRQMNDVEHGYMHGDTTLSERIDDINNRITSLGNGTKIDDVTIKRLLNTVVAENIAKQREAENRPNNVVDLSNYRIIPEGDGRVTFSPDREIRISGIVYMKDVDTVHGEYRTVFAPTRCIEYEANSTFTVPDEYDGLLAQVWLTTAYRPATGNANNNFATAMSPATKVGYVLLKGGVNIPITVGTITSFGQYLTNDGVDRTGMIVPATPIMTATQAMSSESDVRSLLGTGGRVVIYV